MKKLLLLLLLPITLLSQNSWINIDLQTDNFPSETSWELLDNTGTVIATNGSLLPVTLYNTTINLNSGTYIINLMDSYGDGLGGSQWGGVDGWFLIENSCQDTLAFVAGDFGALYTNTLIIAPCAPPTGGCLDPLAINFDPTAAFDDSSCIYPPCAGLDTFWVETYCAGSNIKVHYHWSNMPNPNCRMAYYTRSEDPYALGNNWYPYPSNWSNTGVIWSSNQQPNTTYYFLGQLLDGSYTDTLVITTGECNAGCMDSTALNYNPWANVDDGSCQAPPANCTSGESNIVVMVIPDTYPGETSWDIIDDYGTVLATSPSYNQAGIPIISEICIPDGTTIDFNLYDSFGDGMCGSCYGGVDGTVLVQTLCGDTIYSLAPGNADFGNDTTTTYTVIPCTPNSIPGCMDPGFTEYNPQANIDDGSCATPVILGCIDITSPDYDASANTMLVVPDCDYTLIITDGAQDGWFGSWIGLLQNGATFGPYTMSPADGASNSYTINLSSSSPIEAMFFAPGNSSTTANQCGFYLIGPEGDTTLSGGTNSWTDPILQFPYRYNTIPLCGNYCTPGILGCMDSTALNYDSTANMPNGSCIVIVYGCTNTLAFNYDPTANVDDNSCVATTIGCMDSTAFNFNPSANTNDQSSCIPIIYGCMDDTMFNYNVAANTDDGNCLPIIFGCIDLIAFNYDSLANTDNGSCVPYIYGCIDPTSFNFDVLANTDDGSCIPYIYGCTDPTMFNYNSIANTDNNSCIPFIYGCIDSTMFNFNPLANVDNNSCAPYTYGCTDPSALNYSASANTEDFSCIPYMYGCTDSTAINFDSLANTDNGSCVAVVEGCMDPSAFNYSGLANSSDSASCLYSANCITAPGTPYWLNDPCYAWAISVDNYCCENEWDSICVLTYNYCVDGWTGNLPLARIKENKIIIYPNPTNGIVNFSQEVNVKVYNIRGKQILNKNSISQINLSKYDNGIYNISIIFMDEIFNQIIIKQ